MLNPNENRGSGVFGGNNAKLKVKAYLIFAPQEGGESIMEFLDVPYSLGTFLSRSNSMHRIYGQGHPSPGLSLDK